MNIPARKTDFEASNKNSAATEEFLKADNTQPLKLVIVGHVDDGKSTFIGRLLHETDSLSEGKVEELKNISKKRGMPFEWSFVLDSFQAERDQAITLDVTKIHFKARSQNIIIIDTPGHIEFIKNMVSGAAEADAALLIIDANEGVREQTRRHGYLLHFLGIRQVAVLINKMDLVDYNQEPFSKISQEVTRYLSEIQIQPTFIIPISARHGESIVSRSENMRWYTGVTVLEAMNQFQQLSQGINYPLRFPIQDVYKFDNRRIFVGRIESGSLSLGDKLLFSPSNKMSTVKSLESWNSSPLQKAEAGQSIGITLDEQIFIERGEIASLETALPHISNVFKLTVFWLGENPLKQGKKYKLKLATQEVSVVVEKIECQIDTTTLKKFSADTLEKNSCGEIILRSSRLMAIDKYSDLPKTGRCVLVEEYNIVAAGMIDTDGYPDQRKFFKENTNLTRVVHHIGRENREKRNGHQGGVLWFTGLSASGKSTLAMELEKNLFNKGYQVYVLDGDNIRSGLNDDLGFSPNDRSENIRRIAEVANLFAEAGFICISAFISPYLSDREKARLIIKDNFHEIFIKSDLKTCEMRDPKNLYKKVRNGEIQDFTGISAPYEEPVNSELTIDTLKFNIEECVEQLVGYIEKKFFKNAKIDVT